LDNEKDIIDGIIEGKAGNSSEVDAEFLQDFIAETKEHIENIEMDSLILETEPENIETIHSMFRAFHSIKGLAGFVEQYLIQKLAHQTETLLDQCRKGSQKVTRRLVDMVLSSGDYIKKICESIDLNKDKEFISLIEHHVQELANIDNVSKEEKYNVEQDESKKPKKTYRKKKLGEILVEEGIIKEQDRDEIVRKQKDEYPDLRLGQVILKEKKAEAKDVIEAIRMQEDAKTNKKHSTTEGAFIRVPTNKVDNLVDMMGELIIIESLIEQDASDYFSSNNKFINNLLRMSRIMKDIQNLSMSLRMVALKSTFQKIFRIGRDTVIELGKNVNIQMIGEQTEIDRGIAEKILDPLVHLVKNSISHGIEEDEERIKNGKAIQGKVEIKAYSKRGNIYIEVSDNGRGINIDKVYKKAVEKKIVDPSISYRDDEIMNFIFLPGFSTAEKVDNISGRGVGLDVVKTEMLKIGGKIEISSKPGQGSVFTLKIPINLAVMNGTIVDVLGSRYIIPTLHIKEIVQPKEKQWVSVKGKKTMIQVREDIIPVIPIINIFGHMQEHTDKKDLIIVLELEQKLKALPVRSIIGRREIVVKPLGSEFSNLNFLSGASILGDGKVSLILDIETLFKMEDTI